MKWRHLITKLTISVLFLSALSGCATRPLDPWSQFMQDVLSSARAGDYKTLTRNLTLYRWEEINDFYEQSSALDMTPNQSRPTEDELFAAMLEDVKMFIRSYDDLFTGQPVKYSHKQFEINGVELYSVILWVKKEDFYNGILIHAVWKRPTDFKVLEWVSTTPSDSAGPKLWKQRAILKVKDPQECVYPDRVEYQKVFKSGSEDHDL